MRRNPIGVHAPIWAATCAGHRKIAPPITWFTPMAVKSQRPRTRRRAGASRVVLSAVRMHTTLPRRFYADPEFYCAELERFYVNRWICAGRADQIPCAGDYFTRTIANESVIVARGAS